MNFPCWKYQFLVFILSYFSPKNAFILNLLIIRMF